MKKNLLMALAAALMFTSCSKENDVTTDTTDQVALSVKIDMSSFTTKGGDAPVTTLPAWSQLLLVVTDKDGAFVEEKTLTKTQYDALTTAGEVNLIDKSSDKKLVGGKVTAYIVTTGHEWGAPLSAKVVVPATAPVLPVIASGQLDINKWQATGTIGGSVTGKFVNIPYYGQSAAIAKTGMTADGREKLEATVTVTPELGRIQVLKDPVKGGVLNGITVSSLTVSNVYINKITSGGTVAAPTLVDIRTKNSDVNVDPTTWKANFYAAGKPLAGMTDVSSNKGYQIFNGNTPHVIVEVKYKLTEGVKPEGNEIIGYLTITKFTYTEATTTHTAANLLVNKGKIYDIDLSKLTPTYDQIGEDPYDNTVWHDLVATVNVVPWSIVAVTPVL